MKNRANVLEKARDEIAMENLSNANAALAEIDEMVQGWRLQGERASTDRGREFAIRQLNACESVRRRVLRVQEINDGCNGFRNAGLEPWITAGSLCPCPKAVSGVMEFIEIDEAA